MQPNAGYKPGVSDEMAELREIAKYSFALCKDENMIWKSLLAGTVPVVLMEEERVNRAALAVPVLPIESMETLTGMDMKTIARLRNRFIPTFDDVRSRQAIVENLLLDHWWYRIKNAPIQRGSSPSLRWHDGSW